MTTLPAKGLSTPSKSGKAGGGTVATGSEPVGERAPARVGAGRAAQPRRNPSPYKIPQIIQEKSLQDIEELKKFKMPDRLLDSQYDGSHREPNADLMLSQQQPQHESVQQVVDEEGQVYEPNDQIYNQMINSHVESARQPSQVMGDANELHHDDDDVNSRADSENLAASNPKDQLSMPQFEESDRSNRPGQQQNRDRLQIKSLDLTKLTRQSTSSAQPSYTEAKPEGKISQYFLNAGNKTPIKKAVGITLKKQVEKVGELMTKKKRTEDKVKELKAQQDAELERQILELQKPLPRPGVKVLKKTKATLSAVKLDKSPSATKGKLLQAMKQNLAADMARKTPSKKQASMVSPSPNKKYADAVQRDASSYRTGKRREASRPQELSRIALRNYNQSAVSTQQPWTQASTGKTSMLLEAAQAALAQKLAPKVKKATATKPSQNKDNVSVGNRQSTATLKSKGKAKLSSPAKKVSTKYINPEQAAATKVSKVGVKKRPATALMSKKTNTANQSKSKTPLKGMKKDKLLLQFPSLQQMSLGSPKKKTTLNAKDKAVAAENQYLKSQVMALQKLIEEERQNLQRERELRESINIDPSISQHSFVPASPLPQSPFGFGNIIEIENRTNYDQTSQIDFKESLLNQFDAQSQNQQFKNSQMQSKDELTGKGNLEVAADRKRRFLERQKEIAQEENAERIANELKEQRVLNQKQALIAKDRERSQNRAQSFLRQQLSQIPASEAPQELEQPQMFQFDQMPEFTDFDMINKLHSAFQGGFAKSENCQQVAPNRLRRQEDAGEFQLQSTGGFELHELASQSSRMASPDPAASSRRSLAGSSQIQATDSAAEKRRKKFLAAKKALDMEDQAEKLDNEARSQSRIKIQEKLINNKAMQQQMSAQAENQMLKSELEKLRQEHQAKMNDELIKQQRTLAYEVEKAKNQTRAEVQKDAEYMMAMKQQKPKRRDSLDGVSVSNIEIIPSPRFSEHQPTRERAATQAPNKQPINIASSPLLPESGAFSDEGKSTKTLSQFGGRTQKDDISAFTSPDEMTQSQAAALFHNIDMQSTSSNAMSMDWRKAQSELKKKKKREEAAQSDRERFGNTVSVHSKEGETRRAIMAKTKNFTELLQADEVQRYGDRCPLGYTKVNLQGRGGLAMVWLCQSQMSGDMFAIKQFPKVNGLVDQSALREIEFQKSLFKEIQLDNPYSAETSMKSPGLTQISRLVDHIDEKADLWLVYELGQKTLHERMYKIKREEAKRLKNAKPGEAAPSVYCIQHEVLYQIMVKDKNDNINKECKILRQLVRKMAQALDSIQNSNFVHSDIKPDNILVKLDKDHSKIEELKVIDFGSSFKFDDRMEVTATTPEYLPPEVIYYLEQIGKTPSTQPQAAVELRNASRSWSLDVWSLGVILLEIITGYPVWMAVKCKLMTATNKPKIGQGIFAVKDREPLRIIAAQKKFMKDLQPSLKKLDNYSLCKHPELMDLTKKMLALDPQARLSPKEILGHPFCSAYKCV